MTSRALSIDEAYIRTLEQNHSKAPRADKLLEEIGSQLFDADSTAWLWLCERADRGHEISDADESLLREKVK